MNNVSVALLFHYISKNGCGGSRTRTSDLGVMSPASYRLLYPAISEAKLLLSKTLFIMRYKRAL